MSDKRIDAINAHHEALKQLEAVAPDIAQQNAVNALRVTVLTWRDGDDPRKLIGACARLIEAWRMKT